MPRSPDLPLRSLEPEEIEAYQLDGAICARGLFPDEWVERMAAAVDHAIEHPTPLGDQVSLPEVGFRNDLFVWKTEDAFRDFVYLSPAAHIAQQLLDTREIRFFYDQLFVKPAGCHVATPWHQDVTFWPVEGENICSIWMTFDPVTRDSSGLEFVRGSHRWKERFKPVDPTYNPYLLSAQLPEPPDVEAERERYELLGWDMEPGDVLIFDSVVLHGSAGNYTTDRPRRAFASRWCGEDARFFPRQPSMPLMWEHGLAPGDPLSGPLFPRILPSEIPAEGARRDEGPEPPDPACVERALTAISEHMAEA
ncbi:MAG: phytanoyl-CoA dioxygenase family protein [Myxococcota bacterium]